MAGKPKMANRPAQDDTEFEKMLDEMDELGRKADALREKVNHLIDEMREQDGTMGEGAEAGEREADDDAADRMDGTDCDKGSSDGTDPT